MINRGKFITPTVILSVGCLASSSLMKTLVYPTGFVSKRPPLAQRKFTSKAIEDVIV